MSDEVARLLQYERDQMVVELSHASHLYTGYYSDDMRYRDRRLSISSANELLRLAKELRDAREASGMYAAVDQPI